MVIKIGIISSLIALFFLLQFSSCKKGAGECIGNSYVANGAWKILAQSDSISIGDTLIFSSEIPQTILNLNSQTNVTLPQDYLIGTPFSIRAIKGLNNLTPAIDSFSIFNLKGTLENNSNSPGVVRNLRWQYENNVFKMKFGIVAKKKGNYLFVASDALGRDANQNSNCSNSLYVNLLNSNSDNNADLSHIYYGLNYTPPSDSAHSYSIVVR